MLFPVRRALISVSDKQGVVEFAKALDQAGVEILSTGGTARLLRSVDVKVVDVSEYTGFPEIMEGRVKTLHPKIHGGILARRDKDTAVMEEHGIGGIDLVVVNLYPFSETVSKPGCTLADAIENIDVGGPTMLRAAAKNHNDVAVVVNAQDYESVIQEMGNNGNVISSSLKFRLATKAFEHTAAYDQMIANYLANQSADPDEQENTFPARFSLNYDKKQTMRYGENPHQQAAFYAENSIGVNVTNSQQIQGKALSYNNIADTDAALECVKQFGDGNSESAPACVIVKHANPCGVAIRSGQKDAYDAAFATDPESAFGGIIAFNSTLELETAKAIIDRQFVEVIIAPDVTPQAAAALATKSNVRVLSCGHWQESDMTKLDFKKVNGGLLVQENDRALVAKMEVVTERSPSQSEIADLEFGWKVAKFVKSNAIIYAKNGQTIGVGAGQMSRVNSARIAGIKAEHAGLEVNGAVMASDAFFPFRDGLDNAAAAGINAVIQPGGSKNDDEVIAAANEHGIAMVFTGMRHFRH